MFSGSRSGTCIGWLWSPLVSICAEMRLQQMHAAVQGHKAATLRQEHWRNTAERGKEYRRLGVSRVVVTSRVRLCEGQ